MVIIISDRFGLKPIRVNGTSMVHICKKMDEKRYAVISWDEFYYCLETKGLQAHVDSSSPFLKIMKKRDLSPSCR